MGKLLNKLLGKEGAAVAASTPPTEKITTERRTQIGNAALTETTVDGKITHYSLHVEDDSYYSRNTMYNVKPKDMKAVYQVLKALYEGTENGQKQV